MTTARRGPASPGGLALVAALALLAGAAPASAQYDPLRRTAPQSTGMPAILEDIGIDQRLGERLPAGLRFRDEAGRDVRLGDYFGDRPLVLALVYYDCPMLCHQVLNGLTRALEVLRFDAGREFDVLAISFDPRETPEQAARAKRSALGRYGRPGTASGWHFLTGDEVSIDALTQAAGFRYVYDEARDEWAHGAGIMVLTPQGRLARYFYGIEYSPRDLRFGLIEAADQRIGSRIDQVLLFCYHYDPAAGQYGLIVLNLVRLGGLATLLVLGVFIAVMLRRDRRRAREGYGTGWAS